MSAATNLPVDLDIDSIFALDEDAWNLREGTVRSASEARQIYLSNDVIRGIYDALLQEAGEAWGVILYTCGRTWGKRLARSLSKELRLLHRVAPEQLPVEVWVGWVERFFSHHGWGSLTMHLDDAARHGIVRATMHNSLFAEVLDDVDGMVEPMIAGLLSALLEHVAGQELAGIQTASTGAGHDHAEFLISGPSRIEDLEDLVEEGASPDACLDHLRNG